MKRRVRVEEEAGELNIIPYLDIVTNLVMFMLLSMVGLISLGVLDVGTPKIGEPASAEMASGETPEPGLTLTVGIAERGFYVAGAGGVLDSATDSGSVDTKRPPTVPKKGVDYDYASLTTILSMIKEKYPKESRVILVAEMNVPYDIVIHTMDACRETTGKSADAAGKKKALFPEVWLSMMQ